jgi:hypothetical protein
MNASTRTFTRTEMQRVVILLLFRGCWFEVNPLPEDRYEVSVKSEHAQWLKEMNISGDAPIGKKGVR